MISRYTRPEMAKIWEPQNKYRIWLEVELLICEGLAKLNRIPSGSYQRIKERASFDVERIAQIEKETRHDVIAFLHCLGESIGDDSRYLHLGVTSSDILDTSMAVMLRDAAELILEGLNRLLSELEEKARTYKDTPMIGRTHGIHAEPLTFGLKLALWHQEVARNIVRMKRARESISYGKISGAVGTYAHIAPEVEQHVCRALGLKPAPISSQIIQRDRYAEYFTTLAIVASSIEKFATEIRHLQRTEVLEVEEGFGPRQKGSSAMPHKRNPILSENLCGLARLVRANAIASLENVALWHERDISHSSVERIIAPDSTALVDFMVHRFTGLLKDLRVYPENMRYNLAKTDGLIFSEALMLLLMQKGLGRQRAYELIQRNAMKAWEQGGSFKELLLADRQVTEILTPSEIEGCFDLEAALSRVDQIFHRIFKEEGGSPEAAG